MILAPKYVKLYPLEVACTRNMAHARQGSCSMPVGAEMRYVEVRKRQRGQKNSVRRTRLRRKIANINFTSQNERNVVVKEEQFWLEIEEAQWVG